MINELSDFYLKIKPIIDERGITPSILMRDLDIPSGQFSDWKHGHRNPGAQNIVKIANYLDVSTDYILGLTPVPNVKRLPDNANRLIEIFLSLSVDGQAVVLSSAVQEQRAEGK